MTISALTNISPIDGRYYHNFNELRELASEYALIKNRVIIEIRWLQYLANMESFAEIPPFNKDENTFLEQIVASFSIQDAERIKEIEKTVKHDVKAVEYFIKDAIDGHKSLSKHLEFVHFALTSEDVNNLAYGLMLTNMHHKIIMPTIRKLQARLSKLTAAWADIPMLARTHGQPASPTTMGKEFANFFKRLERQIKQLDAVKITGKLNGATGNYNAHVIAYPDIDWQQAARAFVQSLGLDWNSHTTQIEPHDHIAEYLDNVARINNILLNFCRDIWSYMSRDYLQQKPAEDEVGSSTMPHKINPIDFENAEGNLGVANALTKHLSLKLPISRLQRDLSDSTVLRNLGVSIAHSALAYRAIMSGLTKIDVNRARITAELDDHWEVLAEAVQTVMRKHGIKKPYEKLKALTRGNKITKELLHDFIEQSDLPNAAKEQLQKLTPAAYVGYAATLAREIKQ